jgi:feruloyl esterase
MIGNGGHAGQAPDGPQNAGTEAAAMNHGFVIAATNTGHDAREEPGATFVLSNPQKAIDYAYRAVHLTAVAAKALVKEHYGRPVDYSYWNSCSNGGRQGLIEAQRYPEDFDGVIANAPWVDQTGFMLGAIWNQRALTEAPVPPAKLGLVAERVMATCDAVDGLADGLIDDPRSCDFDPARDLPICPAGADSADCLTPAQAGTLAKIYGGVVSRGQPHFPGFMYGSEAVNAGPDGASRSGWLGLIVPAQPDSAAADFRLAEGTMQYLVLSPPEPDYDVLTFDFDSDLRVIDRWAELANADDPDLSAFAARGGKVLMTYGWADAILQPMMGVNYYERVLEANGPETPDFARLFMIPGMAHCAGGVGPDQHDAVSAVIDWVERDKAPESMIARKVVGGEVVRTRPLCPYPQVARYTGSGSIDDAANFRCVAP